MICRYKIKFISDIEQKIRKLLVNIAVAPFVGVWIEIISKWKNSTPKVVAPFVGVWIEIVNPILCVHVTPVAPFVGVWIEMIVQTPAASCLPVAPFVGVWIEIIYAVLIRQKRTRRSLRGSVD